MQLTPKPKPNTILATYMDDEGYAVSIVMGTPEEELQFDTPLGIMQRTGITIITDPKGKQVKTGFWMNCPEREWDIDRQIWDSMSFEARAQMEVKQQATKYRSLKEQFKSRLN